MILSLVICSILITTRTVLTDKQTDTDRKSSGVRNFVNSNELIVGLMSPDEISGISHYGFGASNRKRRATSILAQIGAAAVQFLLNGARRLRSGRSRFHQRFEKHGDFKTALKDFYSVNPRDVHIEIVEKGIGKGVSKVTGQVGDKKLTLVKKSREFLREPVLDIQSTLPDIADPGTSHLFTVKGNPYDRIIYKKDLKD